MVWIFYSNLILTVMLAFAEYERGVIVGRSQTWKSVARQDPNFRKGRPKNTVPFSCAMYLSCWIPERLAVRWKLGQN